MGEAQAWKSGVLVPSLCCLATAEMQWFLGGRGTSSKPDKALKLMGTSQNIAD